MESSIFRQIAELVREHKTAARAMATFLCLALVVALGTVGVLTYTGQALTRKVKVLTCPYTVHEHTEACLDEEGELVCGYADYVVHVHNDDCFGEDGALVCTLPEVLPHEHTESCYEEVKTAVCGQEEAKGHEHTDACFDRQRGQLTCTQTEHTHGPACYTREEVLTCNKTEQEHIHTDACYSVSRELSCGEAESETHTHTDACYTEVRTLTCDKTTEPHVHGPECYTVNETLVCQIPEHTHTDDCYAWTETLICQIPEGQIPEGGHVHTDECYEISRELTCGKLEKHEHTDECFVLDEDGNRTGRPICGQIELLEHVHGEDCFTIEERRTEPDTGSLFFQLFETHDLQTVCGKEEHTHDESCLDENGQLVCGKEEHVHDASCYPASGEETPAPELVLICGMEEHVHDDSCVGEGNELICGKTAHTHDESCYGYPEASEAAPVYYCGKEEHTHDDSCLDENGQIVCGLEEHSHTEECLVPPPVYYCGLEEHTHDESCLDENGQTVCGLEEHTHTEECLVPAFTQTVEIEGIRVTAKYGPEANIPESAVLKVEQISEDDEHYRERLDDLGDINRQLDGEALIPKALLNMGFFLKDGTEVQPSAPVTVTVQFLDETGAVVGEVLRIVHFADTGVEMMDTTPVDEDLSASFETGGFSDIWVTTSMGTVDGGIMLTSGSSGAVYEAFAHKKTIDFLGDNDGTAGKDQKNKDTTVDDGDTAGLEDLYRLYLDMEGKSEPTNLLFVIDRSSSMRSEIKKNETDEKGERRDTTLANILMGTDGQKGLVEQFLERNKNKTSDSEKSYVACVWFGGEYENSGGYNGLPKYIDSNENDKGTPCEAFYYADRIGVYSERYTEDAGNVFSWTSSYTSSLMNTGHGRGENQIGALPDATDNNVEGTNYCAGLLAAHKMLESVPNDNQTIVIFLSDGLPTYFYQATDHSYNSVDSTYKISRYGEALEDKSIVCAEGLRTSGGETIEQGNGPLKLNFGFFKQTRLFYDLFKSKNPGVRFFTVGIGTGGTVKLRQYDTYLTADEKAKKAAYPRSFSVLEYMGEGGMKEGNSAAALEQVLKEIVFPSSVTITDELSQYVDFLADQPDVLVTATNKKTGAKIELWKGNEFSSGNVYGEATSTNSVAGIGPVVQSVTVEGKTVKLNFEPSYCLSGDYTYTLSFNVKLTEEAFDFFAEHNGSYKVGADEIFGDKGTDYGGNKTSSEMPGLHSNEEAYVKYKIDGQDGKIGYDDPVVQPWGSYLTLIKKDQDDEPIRGVAFKLQWKAEDKTGTAAPKESGGQVTDRAAIGGEEIAGWYFTDENGQIVYDMLHHGTYTLYEYVPPEYEGDSSLDLDRPEREAGPRAVATFTVEEGRIVVEKEEDGDINWTLDPERRWPDKTFGEKGENTLTLTNRKVERSLEIWKYSDEPDGPLEGAAFMLYKAQASGDGYESTGEKMWSEQKVSGKDGLVFDGQLPYGLYALVEEAGPDNYHLLKDPVYFRVNAKGIELLNEVDGVTLETVKDNEKAEKDQFTVTVTDKLITVEAQLIKVDAGEGSKPLANAEFALYGEDYAKFDATDLSKFLGYNESAEALWRGTSGEDGLFKDFPILKAGRTYYLVETKAPDGYSGLPKPVIIRVTGKPDGSVELTADLDGLTSGGTMVGAKIIEGEDGTITYQITVSNYNGFELPESGGEGTAVITCLGLTLVLAASAQLLRKRRTSRT